MKSAWRPKTLETFEPKEGANGTWEWVKHAEKEGVLWSVYSGLSRLWGHEVRKKEEMLVIKEETFPAAIPDLSYEWRLHRNDPRRISKTGSRLTRFRHIPSERQYSSEPVRAVRAIRAFRTVRPFILRQFFACL